MGNLQGGLIEHRDQWLFSIRNNREFHRVWTLIDSSSRNINVIHALYSSRCHIGYVCQESNSYYDILALPRAEIFGCPVLTLGSTTATADESDAASTTDPVLHNANRMITLGGLFLGMRAENELSIFTAIERRYELYLIKCYRRLGQRLLTPLCIPYKIMTRAPHSLVLVKQHVGRDIESILRNAEELNRLSVLHKFWWLAELVLALYQANCAGCSLDWLSTNEICISPSLAHVFVGGFGSSLGLLTHLSRQQAALFWDLMYTRNCVAVSDKHKLTTSSRTAAVKPAVPSNPEFGVYRCADCTLPPERFPEVNILVDGPSSLLTLDPPWDEGVFSVGCLAVRLFCPSPTSQFLDITGVLEMHTKINAEKIGDILDAMPSKCRPVLQLTLDSTPDLLPLLSAMLQPNHLHRPSLKSVLVSVLNLLPYNVVTIFLPFTILIHHPAFKFPQFKARLVYGAVLHQLSALADDTLVRSTWSEFVAACKRDPLEPTILQDSWHKLKHQRNITVGLKDTVELWNSCLPPEDWNWSKSHLVWEELMDLWEIMDQVSNSNDQATPLETEEDISVLGLCAETRIWAIYWTRPETGIMSETGDKLREESAHVLVDYLARWRQTECNELDIAALFVLNMIEEALEMGDSMVVTTVEQLARLLVLTMPFISTKMLSEIIPLFAIQKSLFLLLPAIAFVLQKRKDLPNAANVMHGLIESYAALECANSAIEYLPLIVKVMEEDDSASSNVENYLINYIDQIVLQQPKLLGRLGDILLEMIEGKELLYIARIRAKFLESLKRVTDPAVISNVLRVIAVFEYRISDIAVAETECDFYLSELLPELSTLVNNGGAVTHSVIHCLIQITQRLLQHTQSNTVNWLACIGHATSIIGAVACNQTAYTFDQESICELLARMEEKLSPAQLNLLGRVSLADNVDDKREENHLQRFLSALFGDSITVDDLTLQVVLNCKAEQGIVYEHCVNLLQPAINNTDLFPACHRVQDKYYVRKGKGRLEPPQVRYSALSIGLPSRILIQPSSVLPNLLHNRDWINTISLKALCPTIVANPTGSRIGLFVLANSDLVVTMERDLRIAQAYIFDCSNASLPTPPAMIQILSLDAYSLSVAEGRAFIGLHSGEVACIVSSKASSEKYHVLEPPVVSAISGPFTSDCVAPIFVHEFSQRSQLVVVTSGGLVRCINIANSEERFCSIPTKIGPPIKACPAGVSHVVVLTSMGTLVLVNSLTLTVETVLKLDAEDAHITDVAMLPTTTEPGLDMVSSPSTSPYRMVDIQGPSNIVICAAVILIDSIWYPFACFLDCASRRTVAVLRPHSTRLAMGDVRVRPFAAPDMTYIPLLTPGICDGVPVASWPTATVSAASQSVMLSFSRGSATLWRWFSQDWLSNAECTIEGDGTTVTYSQGIAVVDNWRESASECFFGRSVFLRDCTAVVNTATFEIELHR